MEPSIRASVHYSFTFKEDRAKTHVYIAEGRRKWEIQGFDSLIKILSRALGVRDYRRDMDWILDLCTTCIHH
jgi:hypothetical protein